MAEEVARGVGGAADRGAIVPNVTRRTSASAGRGGRALVLVRTANALPEAGALRVADTDRMRAA